jgi:DNA-binding transcriptional LysR family regulator
MAGRKIPVAPASPLPAVVRLNAALLLSLHAFDAAIRLGSFKAAAAALHLTPSAVSHRITALERALGTQLFSRGHRTISPTASGRTLAEVTGRSFAELARAALPGAGASRLRIAALPLFASEWLIPRLGRFTAAHPEIELMIESPTRHVDLDVDSFDAAIRVGDGNWPPLAAHRLMDIAATPVATRALVRRLRLRRPADLAQAPLIHVTSFPLAWPIWLDRAGVGGLTASQTIWVDGFGPALDLAERGAGVALGLEPLFAAREKAGTLCRPLPIRQPTGGYWLVHRKSESAGRAIAAFRRWLLAETATER